MNERREVTYRGHVQGVGFRFTTQRVARQFPAVTGYVRNEPDGSVRLVCEGEAAMLQEFLGAVEQQLGDFIRESVVDRQAANGEFVEFGIRH